MSSDVTASSEAWVRTEHPPWWIGVRAMSAHKRERPELVEGALDLCLPTRQRTETYSTPQAL
jgi:hypothetical protein